MEQAVKHYVKRLDAALKLGNATEHTYRPALKDLLEALNPAIKATNEPRRIAVGAPDYIITLKTLPVGYIEAKDIGIDLKRVEKSGQMKRYLALPSLLLTDYCEFRWYEEGKLKTQFTLAHKNGKGRLQVNKPELQTAINTLKQFLSSDIQGITRPEDLARRMAGIAQLIRSTIENAMTGKDADPEDSLHQQLKAFQLVLINDLNPHAFADMYAQTICYGMFAARYHHNGGENFTRRTAGYDLPKTNPFLRQMFSHIAGPELDDRIAWAVDDLVRLLQHTDIASVMKGFGSGSGQQDVVVHFYETFLAAYDPKMREARGVYYTPEAVVRYIVRSVDEVLKKDFKLKGGLGDTSKAKFKNVDGKSTEAHRVLVLDPAAGTGTFLYHLIDHIEASMGNMAGAWSSYVQEHLLPRIYGFELLMAPYTIAHMKLGMQLKESGYDFSGSERLRIFLTNTLEEAHELSGLPLFATWLSKEANLANEVKKDYPVMVVMGNPPYSGHSANNSPWIAKLLRGRDTSALGEPAITENYFEVDGKPLGERNPKWLNDDYVKFIRFAQWRIERTGHGVLAFISNNGYLDNPTFRGMRQSLMNTFDDIYIMDLHGSTKKKETCADGSKDDNVFDIQQGVAIGIFVKRKAKGSKTATVRHAELFGRRNSKYQWLEANTLKSTKWAKLKPKTPDYLFIPRNTELAGEYETNLKITDILQVNSVGVVTARDGLTIDMGKNVLLERVKNFASLPVEEARSTYKLGKDVRDWKISLAQEDIHKQHNTAAKIVPLLYRPFDKRYTFYTGLTRGFICMPRPKVMRHMLAGENVSLLVGRAGQVIGSDIWDILFCSKYITEFNLYRRGGNNLFPLYLYPDADSSDMLEAQHTRRRPNLSEAFIKDISARLKLRFIADGCGDLKTTLGPEDIFHYMYAVFHSPGYRSRYAEFLKIDFPRLPLTSNKKLFRSLCSHGQRLKELHLMEGGITPAATFPETGDNSVDKPRYDEAKQRVYINKAQYFGNVPPEVWAFHIGGYQVCQKWLKDRKGRCLSFEDLKHYLEVVAILGETIDLMAKIDAVIEKQGGWPLQ